MESNRSFLVQLQILTKRMVLRVVRRPLAELPNLIISAFFLFVYDGALGGVFGGAASGTPFDFAKGNFINFIYYSKQYLCFFCSFSSRNNCKSKG